MNDAEWGADVSFKDSATESHWYSKTDDIRLLHDLLSSLDMLDINNLRVMLKFGTVMASL